MLDRYGVLSSYLESMNEITKKLKRRGSS